VAYSEQALGVNVGLNLRKIIGIILAAVTLAIGGVGEREISEKKTFVNKFNGTIVSPYNFAYVFNLYYVATSSNYLLFINVFKCRSV